MEGSEYDMSEGDRKRKKKRTRRNKPTKEEQKNSGNKKTKEADTTNPIDGWDLNCFKRQRQHKPSRFSHRTWTK